MAKQKDKPVIDEPAASAAPAPAPPPRRGFSGEDLAAMFSYHAPSGDQPDRYEHVRAAARAFAAVIVKQTPVCADQTAALRKLREVVYTANAAIACGGRF